MNSIVIFPVGDRVLVRLRKTENVSKGGIVLATPRTSRLEQLAECVAEVVRVGPLAWESQAGGAWAHVGDKVLISKYAGIAHQDGEDEYRLVTDVDILAVVAEVTQ